MWPLSTGAGFLFFHQPLHTLINSECLYAFMPLCLYLIFSHLSDPTSFQ